MSKLLMSGNEALARGAWEAGCTVAAAYPGTPSTEILENIGAFYREDVYCQWAANEKVAMEITAGAAIGGARALCAMKHVGLNVAADPLFSIAYAGVNGGLVVISADDPGCHSSQNEQDNRLYAPLARLIMLEPADSQECLDFIKQAFVISEQFDTPVLIRVTTRVCHSKSLVQTGERTPHTIKPYVRQPGKYALLPVNARTRHVAHEEALAKAADFSETTPLNRREPGDKSLGIITSGICYQHAREVWPEASFFKLGFSHPLPEKALKEFAAGVERVLVIEEGEPYLETYISALGLTVSGKDKTTRQGELSPLRLRKAFGLASASCAYDTDEKAAPRPPVLCAGCPHRGFYLALQKYADKLRALGDIGCYSLGVSPPLNGFDVTICMGAGFSAPIGFAKALEQQGDPRKVFGILGDSTFFHSGMNSLLDIIHAQANVCACILDNSITAMTGHQDNPGTQRNLMGETVTPVSMEAVVRAFGITDDRLRIVDPLSLADMEAAIADALAIKGPFVILTQRPCALIPSVRKAKAGRHVTIDPALCKGCRLCMKTGCPSLGFAGGQAFVADPANCAACGLCEQFCRFGAIKEAKSL